MLYLINIYKYYQIDNDEWSDLRTYESDDESCGCDYNSKVKKYSFFKNSKFLYEYEL